MLSYQEVPAAAVYVMLVTMIAVTAAVCALIYAVYKAHVRRCQLLEQALEHPSLDGETKRELVAQLTKTGVLRGIVNPRLLAGAGWIGVFVGLGCLTSGERGGEEVGPIIALVSFGVLSTPFALRELDARRAPSPRGPS